MNNNLLNLRENNDLLQKDLADRIGINRRTYSSWENGTKIIPLKHLNTLCNCFNVSMDYIMCLNKNSITNNVNELNKKEIGNRIKHIREKYDLTVRDLAKDLNTTPSTISSYENGKTLILTAFAYQICKKYKISLDWLCGRK